MIKNCNFLLCIIVALVFGTKLFADTIEERVSRLEMKVRDLEGQKPIQGLCSGPVKIYKASNNCSEINLQNQYYRYDFQFTIIKKIKCDHGTFIIGTHIVPKGWADEGTLSVDAFNEKDVILP